MEGGMLNKFSEREGSLNANGGENFEKIHFDRPLKLGTEGYIM